MSIVFSASSTVWVKKKVSILPSSVTVIDSFTVGQTDQINYMFHFKNTTSGTIKSLKLDCHIVDPSNVRELVYAGFGDSINIEINPSLSLGTFEISLTNNEADPLIVKFARIKL